MSGQRTAPAVVEEAVKQAVVDGVLDSTVLSGARSATEMASMGTPAAPADEESLNATLEQLRDEDGDR